MFLATCAAWEAFAAPWGGLLPGGRASARAISHSGSGSLVLVSGGELWRTENDGRDRAAATLGRPALESGRPVAIEHVGLGPPVVYVSGASRLFRSADGATWAAIDGFGPPREGKGSRQAIVQTVVSPVDADRLLVAMRGVRGGGMLSSQEGGRFGRAVGACGAGDHPSVESVHPHTGMAYVRHGLAELFLRRDPLTGGSTQLGRGPVGFARGMDAGDVGTVYIRGVNDDEAPFGADWVAPAAVDGVDGPFVLRSFAYHPSGGTLYAVSSPRVATVQANVAVLFAARDEGATWTQAAPIPLSVGDVASRKRLQLYFLPGSQFMYLHTGASVYRSDLADRGTVTPDERARVTWANVRRAR
ncbi:hypothetical protein CMK11_10065 [Candidatus Poribacteria bacterium]|nr:hypothetical protein [Candidatus Poribacteria bacterium]